MFSALPPKADITRCGWHVRKVQTTDMHWIYGLALPTGIQNIEHRAVGGSALRALSDRFRQDSFELDEVREFIANVRQMHTSNLVHERSGCRALRGRSAARHDRR